MFTPRKLIAFLTLTLTLFSTFAFADCTSLGSGWVQGTSSNNVVVCVPTGDNPNGAISSGEPVLTQNGKDYYAPPSSMADKLKIDSTGRIGRTLDEVTRITRADGSTYVYTTSVTFYTEAGDASTAVWTAVKNNPALFPSLSPLVSAATTPPAPAVGVVVSAGGANRKILYKYSSHGIASQYAASGVGQYYISASGYLCYTTGIAPYNEYYVDTYVAQTTTEPESPNIINNSILAPSVSASPAAIADIDKYISQNPDSFKKSYTPSATEGITAPPIPTALTAERIREIYAGNGAPAGTGGPIIGPGGTPTLPPPVEIPQSSDPGGSGGGGDPTQPPSPDIYGPGYTPGYNNSPYGSDGPGGSEFGNRLSQFMSDLRGSSLFSLPTSILGNIPSSGTSVISFDGGEFGQQSFDFAAFSNQLMVIRSVLLLCFSLLSIRIVTLKR